MGGMMNTPSYVIIEQSLLENFSAMQKRMSPCRVAYSMKANPCKEVVNILKNTEACFEISSLAEAKTLHDLQVDPSRMYCGLVVMSEKEIYDIYEQGCRVFTYDSSEQLRRIIKCCGENVKRVLRIRINDLVDDSIGFGMNLDLLEKNPECLEKASGLSFHISDHSDMSLTIEAVRRLAELSEKEGANIEMLNIGGSYSLYEDEEGYVVLRNYLKDLVSRRNIEILCEPGSAVVNTAVDALSRCIMVINQDGFLDVFIDGGIPSGMTRKPDEIVNLSSDKKMKRTICRFFDTTSMKKLLFTTRIDFTVNSGDILLFKGYGAYSYCYSNIFHSRNIPKIYTVGKENEIDSLV